MAAPPLYLHCQVESGRKGRQDHRAVVAAKGLKAHRAYLARKALKAALGAKDLKAHLGHKAHLALAPLRPVGALPDRAAVPPSLPLVLLPPHPPSLPI